MKHIYIIKSFDTQGWIETHNIIAFNTEDEARKYCKIHDEVNNIIYTWDRVLIGGMKPPYLKRKKNIVIAP